MMRSAVVLPFLVVAVVVLVLSTSTSTAFVVAPGRGAPPSRALLHPLQTDAAAPSIHTQLHMVFNKKNKKDEDLSYIETRDMTPAEMRALNAKNEEIMNAELIGMTVFSLVLSVPMLYLVWVGFFSETAGTIDDALPY